MLPEIHNGDRLTLPLFGRETELMILATGDSQYDHDEEDFPLNQAELACVNWLLESVHIEDYTDQIVAYCNERYEMIGGPVITAADLAEEVELTGIAVSLSEVMESNSGHRYPDVSFLGECACDPEHGICIGFRDREFLGIESQDWAL